RVRFTVNMTPMIDVVLLVIIFFLYTARFAEVSRTSVDLPDEPGVEDTTSDPDALMIDVRADGVFLVSGRARSLERVIEIVEEQADRVGGPENLRVLLRADQGTAAGPVNELARRLTNMGDLPLTPLIDVVFLLLIYFMVTATITPPESRVASTLQGERGAGQARDLKPQILTVDLTDGVVTFRMGSRVFADRDSLNAALEQLPKEGGLFVRVTDRAPWSAVAGVMQDALDAGFVKRTYVPDAAIDDRRAIAKRLAELYVELLGLATSAAERQRIEQLGQRLTRQLPEEDAGDLRLALVRARYQWAKEVAERARLNLVPAEELEEAERTLRSLAPELSSVAQTASEAAYRLDRRRTAVGLDEQEQEAYEAAARVRSTAHYLLGWTRYYLAVMTGGERYAMDALKDLGVLLGAEENRAASVERADERLMRFDHVADAAIAAAFCESLLGNADTAIRWIDKIESAATLSEGIRERLFVCRLLVLGEAGRWRDLAYHSDRMRRSRRADGEPGLEPLEAQLLANVSWEALTRQRLAPRDQSVLEEIAHAAIQDLVRQDQVAVLRSLVEQFGTSSLEGEGFIFAFVRGQNAYERATDAYEAAGYTDGEIATDDA
ncbi:Uncharacterized protein SCF082_LOCUS12066, partial [Durusdinium trenchii]